MNMLHPRAVWIFFISFVIGWFVSFIGVFVALWFIATDPAANSFVGFQTVLAALLGIFFLLLIVAYIWARLSYNFYRYELRAEEFRKEHGVIFKKYVSIPYDRIQNIDIYRGLVARILGLSDIQIQTAGGISAGSYGSMSEGRLPGLSKDVAEQMRDELLKRARQSRSQGL